MPLLCRLGVHAFRIYESADFRVRYCRHCLKGLR